MIRLFGPLTIEVDNRVLGPRDLGGTRPKRVLEILLAARGHRVPTDRLADLLWGGELPRHPSGSIQTFVSLLRRILVPDPRWARELLVTEPEAYRFAADLVDLDLDRFDMLVERARREPSDRARRLLDEAVALVRGDVLEDEPYALWAQDLREEYQGRVLGLYRDAADRALAAHDYPAALAHAETAARLDRFDEPVHRLEMLALYALGRQHEALHAYRRLRQRLDEELGLEPTAETRALESAILRQEDLGSLVTRPVEPARRAPRPTSGRLLGRATELEALERSARDALGGSFSLVLLEGEAGVGKTRLLDELARRLSGTRLGRGRGSPLEQDLPYVPFAEAVRDAIGPIDATGRMRSALAAVLPELSLEGAARAASLDTLEALAKLLSENAPLALLLDDMQWSDLSTLAAISYLRRRCVRAPLALIAAVGTEQTPPHHPVRRLEPTLHIRLEPLTPAELAPLGGADLHERTGGNPRFVAEVLGEARNCGPPAAIADELLGRVRAEGTWACRVLLAASVLGRSFDPAPLATLLEVDSVELAEELDRLCERGILAVDGFGFRFRYDLTRDVLLASVSPARKRLLEGRLDQAPHEPDRPLASPADDGGHDPAGAGEDRTFRATGRRRIAVSAARGA